MVIFAIGGAVVGVGSVIVGAASYDDYSCHSDYSDYSETQSEEELKLIELEEEKNLKKQELKEYKEANIDTYLPEKSEYSSYGVHGNKFRKGYSAAQLTRTDVDELNERVIRSIDADKRAAINNEMAELKKKIGEIDRAIKELETIKKKMEEN